MTVVSSKFAVLPDDVDDLNKRALRNKLASSGKVEEKDKKTSTNTGAKAKKNKNKNKKKENKSVNDSKDLQALAFGGKKKLATNRYDTIYPDTQ